MRPAAITLGSDVGHAERRRDLAGYAWLAVGEGGA
jgi:hypothetical protein